ncbi:hypothetical protein A1F94_010623 [Pyrenophora tritici-repentis]|uniref:Uncharacterized protein n=2 Tax=Pyrenophora tritici-repentis TaxID=45151 RepID=A0A2W1I1J6_9PLEO|nr:hypothetical protein PtrV1_11811 [Pyrenophora tritici-repentis]KAF7444605.1 hypothetical protein A1F99_111580 [Pyrenophora tritici-repentis]KAG9378854.1 hypothetical protein A1F94_010623 [Pyrenophora tritici-repentis]KAI0578172.1 hypothetical protein Alg215_06498 [Pyrenophora tritici-repentis]KAI1511169.1 hypothetical protein Ptr86124_009573 [Pyrenophora tritici-repentis]
MAPSSLPARPGGPPPMIRKGPVRVRKVEKKRKRKGKAIDKLVALFDSGKIDLATKDEAKAPEDSSVANLLAEPNVPSKQTKRQKHLARGLPEEKIFEQYECRVCHVLCLDKGARPPKGGGMGICFDCDMAALVVKPLRGNIVILRKHRRVRFCLVCGHAVCQPRNSKHSRYCACIISLLSAKSKEEAVEIERIAAYEICKELRVAKPEELPTYKPEFKLETTPLPGISSGSLFIHEKQKAIKQQILEESRSDMNKHQEEVSAMEV